MKNKTNANKNIVLLLGAFYVTLWVVLIILVKKHNKEIYCSNLTPT